MDASDPPVAVDGVHRGCHHHYAALAGGKEPAFWVYLLALIPLALLLLTGLYPFVLPYAARWRGGRHVDG